MTEKLMPIGVNHVAYQTTKMEETHRFYTETLGFDFAGSIRSDGRTMMSGEVSPAFFHAFYRSSRGDCIAFFDVDGEWEPRPDGLARFTRHLAFTVADEDELLRWQETLRVGGLDVSDVADHDGIWHSIYFYDPNGIRLELTNQVRGMTEQDAERAESELRSWLSR